MNRPFIAFDPGPQTERPIRQDAMFLFLVLPIVLGIIAYTVTCQVVCVFLHAIRRPTRTIAPDWTCEYDDYE